ncbi:MAG: hypothetical protein LBM08_01555 [Dysgonamonadaceae bacterium]|nr:hypothetical protein [Dysgonamonadaceae bacterium]
MNANIQNIHNMIPVMQILFKKKSKIICEIHFPIPTVDELLAYTVHRNIPPEIHAATGSILIFGNCSIERVLLILKSCES